MNTTQKRVTSSFYRRPLPSNAIDFSSNEGKIIFREAMEEGMFLIAKIV
jgi:hypothetical protein